jgi:hypothetical protein
MRNALLPRWLLLGIFMVAASACDEKEGSCEPGEEVECSCDDGEDGTRYCLSNRRFDECYCGSDLSFPPPSSGRGSTGSTGSTGSSARDAGSIDAGRDAGLDAGLDAGPLDGVLLASGSERLLDMFASEQDVWLVLPSRVMRISQADGGVQASWSAPRPLTGAVFDGERLIALDAARLTMLSLDALQEVSGGNLTEPCTSAAISAERPLLCASSADLFALYALEPVDGGRVGALRGTRTNGKLLAVPGTSRFMSLDGNGSGFFAPQLLETDADGGLAFVGDGGVLVTSSSSSSSFAPPFGFDSVPPQNLVTRTGVLHRVSASCGSPEDPCFARTGTLGTLGAQEAFLGMSTSQTQLFGLVDPSTNTTNTQARCDQQPCRLQRIDVTERLVRGQRAIRRPLRSIIAMHALPDAGALVLAFGAVGTDRFFSSFADAGYEVVRLDLPEDE